MTKLHALPAPKPRISAKIRAAVECRVREGLTIQAAAEKAGLSRNGFAKALKRPAVLDLMDATQRKFIADVDGRRALLRARAYEVAAELLEKTTSESVKVRLIEFLCGDGKAPQVAVHVDARQEHRPAGYEYVRPGQKVVVIEGPGVSRRPEASEE